MTEYLHILIATWDTHSAAVITDSYTQCWDISERLWQETTDLLRTACQKIPYVFYAPMPELRP